MRRELFLLACVLTSCAVPKVGVPLAGSRADGTVQMAYEYGLFEAPVLNLDGTHANAAQTCAGWGYRDAQPFGGTMTRCEQTDGRNCVRWLVTMGYQCVGAPGQ